jgi:hypothetical protein
MFCHPGQKLLDKVFIGAAKIALTVAICQRIRITKKAADLRNLLLWDTQVN